MSASPAIEIEATIGDAVATMGFIPAILPSVLAMRNYDALDYHRRGVLKDAKKNFPKGIRAQRFLAARMFRFGRTTGSRLPDTVAQARGEGFMAERPGLIEALEKGGDQTTADPMAIPVAARFRKMTRDKFEAAIKARKFEIVPGHGLAYIINPSKRAGGKADFRLGGHQIVGVLKRRTKKRPLLHWYRRWQANLPKVLAKYEKDLAKVTTASGRQALRERITKEHNVQRAASIAKQAYLDANPGNNVGAARAARSAAAQVKKDSLAKTITVSL